MGTGIGVADTKGVGLSVCLSPCNPIRIEGRKCYFHLSPPLWASLRQLPTHTTCFSFDDELRRPKCIHISSCLWPETQRGTEERRKAGGRERHGALGSRTFLAYPHRFPEAWTPGQPLPRPEDRGLRRPCALINPIGKFPTCLNITSSV